MLKKKKKKHVHRVNNKQNILCEIAPQPVLYKPEFRSESKN